MLIPVWLEFTLQFYGGKVEKVDARSAGEGALPFGQRVMFAVLRGRQPPLAAEGGGIACGDEFYIPPVGGRKTFTTGLRPLEMHPYPPPAAVLLLKGSMSLDSQVASLPYESSSFATPEGEVLAALCLEILMSPETEWRANLPLRGGKRT